MRVLLLVVCMLALLACQSAGVVGKITVDPNAGGERVEVQDSDKDARLAQKITYEARHKAVKTILADLSEMAGVTFKAGYNEKDWQVRDRKMNIFAKDIPLSRLMSSIARVMKFRWSINRDVDPWIYRLYMDRKTLLGADAELYRAQDAFDKEVTRRRENYVKMIEGWSDDISSDEMDQLRENNPYLYFLHARGAGAAIQGLFRDVPGIKEAFINRESGRFVPISSLSPETQQAVLNAAKMKYQLKGYQWAGNGEPFPEDAESAFTTGKMWFDIQPREFEWDSIQHRKLGGIGLYINDRFFQMTNNICEPSDPLAQLQADIELQAYEQDVPVHEAWERNSSDYARVEAEESKAFDSIFPKGPVVEHPDEPALHNKIKVTLNRKERARLVDLQAAFAEASGFAVVSDSFKLIRGNAVVSDAETALKDVLTTIADGYRYDWEKHGPAIEFRSKDWFRNRTNQIPDEWVDQWRARFKKLGYLSVEDYGRIAMLTNDQIEENLYTDDVFGHLGLFYRDPAARSLMRLYASLSLPDRAAMLSGVGLDMKSLGPEQWEALSKILNVSPIRSGEASALLKCDVVSGKEGRPQFTFAVISHTDGGVMGKWTIPLPKYPEPPKPKAEPNAVNDKKGGGAQPVAKPAP